MKKVFALIAILFAFTALQSYAQTTTPAGSSTDQTVVAQDQAATTSTVAPGPITTILQTVISNNTSKPSCAEGKSCCQSGNKSGCKEAEGHGCCKGKQESVPTTTPSPK